MSEHDSFHWEDAARWQPDKLEPAPRKTDADLIAEGIEAARERGMDGIVTDQIARVIASAYHSGQASEFYSFASTGRINKEALAPELLANLLEAHPDDHETNAAIEALGLYFLATPDRDSVDGWHESTRW